MGTGVKIDTKLITLFVYTKALFTDKSLMRQLFTLIFESQTPAMCLRVGCWGIFRFISGASAAMQALFYDKRKLNVYRNKQLY